MGMGADKGTNGVHSHGNVLQEKCEKRSRVAGGSPGGKEGSWSNLGHPE